MALTHEPGSVEAVVLPAETVPTLDPAADPPVRPGDPRRVAVLVCHGMGQQVRFQTLGDLARLLFNAPRTQVVGPVGVQSVRLGSNEAEGATYRARATLRHDDHPDERIVDLYEAYWAPLMEGKVGIRDVITFLAVAGWQGYWFTRGKATFTRWMFGGPVELEVKRTTTRWRLAMALAVVLGLVVINAAVGLVGISRIVRGTASGWPSNRAMVWIAWELLALVLLLTWIGLALRLLRRETIRRGRTSVLGPPSRRSPALAWIPVWGAIVLIVLLGVAIPIELAALNGPSGEAAPARIVVALLALLWVVVHALSMGISYFLVEYVGDVAAYVSSHTVSKFNDLRQEVQKISCTAARGIYAALDASREAFAYGRVIVIGHSLGSVVAYDTLNAMIREDRAASSRIDAARRTRMLLTFGSPLNKTAYIFRMRLGPGNDVREALAAAAQPLIDDYACRPEEWVNIHSKADWICGPIQYYDDAAKARAAGAAGKVVQNIVDPDAATPLAAHSEYWFTTMVPRQLVRAIFQ